MSSGEAKEPEDPSGLVDTHPGLVAGKTFSAKKIRENRKSRLSVGSGFLFIGRNFHRF
jgi:hypothetical protein